MNIFGYWTLNNAITTYIVGALSTMLYCSKLARFTGGAAVLRLCECPLLSTAVH